MTACANCGFQNAEGVKFCAECGQNLVGTGLAPRETRRTVTVLFADVTGSTALGEQLDPESLRTLMGRYFAAIKQIVERHGGTVEKFIGDAVMAVFGIPTLHEDDALRAVRAAAEIRDTLAALNEELQRSRGLAVVFRTGVNTGTVVAGDPSAGQTLVTGDTVNTAARLEQAATPGEILLGQTTYRLVRDAVVAEPIEPIGAKGKTQPVPAYRLSSVIAGAAGHARRLDAPLVGRDRELHVLGDAFERSVADRAGQMVTVLGTAGVGKSRLVHEFRQRVDGRATFLLGRCLSYGEGISYWPLAEALGGVVDVDQDKPLESWRGGLAALVAGQSQAEAIVNQVLGLIGVGEASGGDAFWSVRRLLEGMAREQPLVFVVDDLHWATPTFLDLVEHLADWIRDAPILLVCLARPELLEARPGWGGGKLNATTFLLEPLDTESIDALLAHLLGRDAAGPVLPARIAAAAEGNPLFVEELVAMLVERQELMDHDDRGELAELEVPPTIEALMAARLDQLPQQERAVLERASVIGTQFGAGEVARLSDEQGPDAVRPALMAMLRRDLLRPDPEATLPMGADDEAFRFRHQLIRDGAYVGMSKAERARLHERYASLLEELPPKPLPQLDEVVGYHLEQACQYRHELGGDADAVRRLAVRAAGHLRAGARRADGIGDRAAVVGLVERANALLPADDPERIGSLPLLASALAEVGRFGDAQGAIDEVLAAQDAPPSARAEALEQVDLAFMTGRSAAQVLPAVDEALALRRELGDPAGIASALSAASGVAFYQGRLKEARRLAEEGIRYAREAGDLGLEARLRMGRGLAGMLSFEGGPAMEGEVRDNIAFARANGQLAHEAGATNTLSLITAMRGYPDEALQLVNRAREIARDLGTRVWEHAFHADVVIEMWRGNPGRAAERLRSIYEGLTAMGERGYLSGVALELATALLDMDEADGVDELCQVANAVAAADDVVAQVELLAVRSRLLARRGEFAAAETLAQQAIEMGDETEFVVLFTSSRLTVADVLRLAGRPSQAVELVREVLAMEERRGNDLYAATLREQIQRLEVASLAGD